MLYQYAEDLSMCIAPQSFMKLNDSTVPADPHLDIRSCRPPTSAAPAYKFTSETLHPHSGTSSGPSTSSPLTLPGHIPTLVKLSHLLFFASALVAPTWRNQQWSLTLLPVNTARPPLISFFFFETQSRLLFFPPFFQTQPHWEKVERNPPLPWPC